MSALTDALGGIGLGFNVTAIGLWLRCMFLGGSNVAYRFFIIGFTLWVVQDAAQRSWGRLLFDGAVLALNLWDWWHKDRRKVRDVLGAKARALRDALVRKAREAATPRPVLRPVPGGAR